MILAALLAIIVLGRLITMVTKAIRNGQFDSAINTPKPVVIPGQAGPWWRTSRNYKPRLVIAHLTTTFTSLLELLASSVAGMILPGLGRVPMRLSRSLRPSSSSVARSYVRPSPPFFSSAQRASSRSAPSSSTRAAGSGACSTAAGLRLRLRLRTVLPGSLRALHGSGRAGARLGQITPKRVAVIDGEIVDGLPRPSIWRPIVVSSGGEELGEWVVWSNPMRAIMLWDRRVQECSRRSCLWALAIRSVMSDPSSPSASPSPALPSLRST